MTPGPHPIIAQLRRLREEAGMSQQQLSERSGLGKSAIASWEQGRVSPGLESISLYAQALGCELTARPIPGEYPVPRVEGRRGRAPGARQALAAARASRAAERTARIEDYVELREQGLSVEQAAARLGIALATTPNYHTALRRSGASYRWLPAGRTPAKEVAA